MAFLESFPPIATHLLVLLVGIFIGAAGQYLGERFTDQRRNSEETKKAQSRFKEVEKLMPELIREMRVDLLGDKTGVVREFYAAAEGAIYGPGTAAMYYDPETHEHLESYLMVLENHGYITNVATTGTPRYRMSEEFVALVKDQA